MLNGMKQWLLKQKQVQVWESSVSTADAVYAFLCMGSDTLGEGGSMEATVGKTTWQTPQDALGYARKTFTGTDAEADDIRISRTGEGLGWGAVYAQYLEDMDKVLPSKGTGLQIERTLYRDGKALSRNAELHVGDKVTVRLTVSADRDMDFVQVKDERAACMEPEQQLSGYGCRRALTSWNIPSISTVPERIRQEVLRCSRHTLPSMAAIPQARPCR